MRSARSKPSLARSAVVLVAVTILSAACSTSGAGSTPVASSAVMATPVTTGPASTAAASPAATPAAAGGSANVNLVFTGTSAFEAKGTNGTCKVLQVDGAPHFGFEATEADYPGLGMSFSMAELTANSVDVKWVVDAKTAYGNNPASHIDLGSDHKLITIDQDLIPFTSGGVTAGPEHVKGVIGCP